MCVERSLLRISDKYQNLKNRPISIHLGGQDKEMNHDDWTMNQHVH